MTRQRWMALCFALGSTCFLIGPFPGYAQLVGDLADAVTFFVGSILFEIPPIAAASSTCATASAIGSRGSAHTSKLESSTTASGTGTIAAISSATRSTPAHVDPRVELRHLPSLACEVGLS